MKTNLKRILSIAIILFILLQIVMPLIVKAKTNYPTLTEAKKLVEKLPDEIKLNIKESEFLELENENLVGKTVANLLGIDKSLIFWELCYITNEETYERNYDIHNIRVGIIHGDGSQYWYKDVKVQYSNSNKWKQEDANYIEKLLEKTDFNVNIYGNIYSDGTEENPFERDFDWKEVLEKKEEFKSKNIKIINAGGGQGGEPSYLYVKGNLLYFVKDDIVYNFKNASKCFRYRILVPDNIEETDEAYIKYAKPVIEKCMFEESDKYTYRGVVNNIKRDKKNSTHFTVELKYEIYQNGVLEETYNEEFWYVISKKNEYRASTNVKLKEMILQKDYIKGTIKAEEIELIDDEQFAITHGFGETIPTLKLIDSAGKETKLEVTLKDYSTFEFKIPMSLVENNKEYKIFVENPFKNNTNPDKNAYISKNETKKTEIKNDGLTLTINEKSNIVTLKINGKIEQKLGDVNGDNKIDTLDAVMILQSVAKKITLNANQKASADVNKDGKVDTLDAVRILQFVAKKISKI